MEHTGERHARIQLRCDQELLMVVRGQGREARLMANQNTLVAFESLWHAGSLVHELRASGAAARTVSMPVDGLHSLARGMDRDLWILRHDGSIVSVDDVVYL
ncbi:MAG: hypothetical protein ACOC7Y_00605 [Chloroflexota bacterium]